ncbi:MAG: ABC transporter permease [Rubrobacteraceae bacterium]
MNPTITAVRAGFWRGMIEFRQTWTNVQDLWGNLFWPVAILIVMVFLRGVPVPGTEFSLSAMTIPGVIGMQIAFGGLSSLAAILLMDREDGTLLRAKAIPKGMLGYLIGKVVTFSGVSLVGVAIILFPGALLFGGLQLTDPGVWFTFAWVLLIGLVATMPIGAVLGSLFSSTNSLALIFVPLMALVAISGIFYPITALPVWLQWIAQIFPVYWLGLGMRSALLPDSLASVEIGGSWRHLETLGVLGAWAAIGLILAPIVLRRMARRESGSSVAERREKVLQQRWA